MMKKLQHFSVEKLNKIARHKDIYCYGCGKIFYELVDRYKEELFVQKIIKVVDGKKELWGTTIKINGKELLVESPEVITQNNRKDVFVVITTNRYEEVYGALCTSIHQQAVACSKYPDMYYTFTRYLLSLFGFFTYKKRLLFRYDREPHENAVAIIGYLKEYQKIKDYRVVLLTEKECGSQRYVNDHICISKDMIQEKSSLKNMMKYCYYYGRAKYLFYENEVLEKVSKKQTLIFLNHGTIPFKNVKDVLKQLDTLDYAICPSKKCADIYREQYGIPIEKQIYCMQPRVSLLFTENKHVKESLGYENKKIVLWLPTFRSLQGSSRRDSHTTDIFSIISADEWNKLDELLTMQNQLLVIKNHPREEQEIQLSPKYKSIRILQDKDLERADVVLQELLGVTDALITDYSGIMFEYLFLNRPIGFMINDMKEYHRGFCFENPLEYMPGKHMEEFNQLLGFLKELDIGSDNHENLRLNLRQKMFGIKEYRDGAAQIIDFIEKEKI